MYQAFVVITSLPQICRNPTLGWREMCNIYRGNHFSGTLTCLEQFPRSNIPYSNSETGIRNKCWGKGTRPCRGNSYAEKWTMEMKESYAFVAQVANPTREISGLPYQRCHVRVLRVVERRLHLQFHVGRIEHLVPRSTLTTVSIHVVHRAIS